MNDELNHLKKKEFKFRLVKVLTCKFCRILFDVESVATINLI